MKYVTFPGGYETGYYPVTLLVSAIVGFGRHGGHPAAIMENGALIIIGCDLKIAQEFYEAALKAKSSPSSVEEAVDQAWERK